MFTFIYSKREGTPAATLVNDTPHEVVQRRFDRLVEVVQDQAFRANQRDVDTTVDVLVEGASKRDEAIMAGKSPKNQTVHARLPEGVSASDLAGRIVQVRVDEARTWYLSGEVVGGETAPAFVVDGPGEDPVSYTHLDVYKRQLAEGGQGDGDDAGELARALAVLDRRPPRAKNLRDAAYRRLVQKGYGSSVASSAARRWCERQAGGDG